MQTVLIFKKPDYFSSSIRFPIMAVKVGEAGYWQGYEHQAESQGLSDEVIESAIAGSMFGWDCPAAQAAMNYAKSQEVAA